MKICTRKARYNKHIDIIAYMPPTSNIITPTNITNTKRPTVVYKKPRFTAIIRAISYKSGNKVSYIIV